MLPNLTNEIREHLRSYLDDQASLEAFQEWLVPNTWNIEQSEDRKAEELVYRIELLLAEHSSGQWSTQKLRSMLNELLHRSEPAPESLWHQ